MLNIMPITTKYVTVYIQFNYLITIYIATFRLQSIILLIFTCCVRIQCSYFWPIMHNIMLLRKLVPHFIPSCDFITILQKISYRSFNFTLSSSNRETKALTSHLIYPHAITIKTAWNPHSWGFKSSQFGWACTHVAV